MPIPSTLAYPSDEDIRYAMWLKHFVSKLPAYADRYGLLPLQVLEVQCVVGEFLDLLIHRMHCASTSILLHQLTVIPLEYEALLAEAESQLAYERVLRGIVAEAVTHLLLHPAYTDQDGLALGLVAKPFLLAGNLPTQ